MWQLFRMPVFRRNGHHILVISGWRLPVIEIACPAFYKNSNIPSAFSIFVELSTIDDNKLPTPIDLTINSILIF